MSDETLVPHGPWLPDPDLDYDVIMMMVRRLAEAEFVYGPRVALNEMHARSGDEQPLDSET
jgi:hypothetical protein